MADNNMPQITKNKDSWINQNIELLLQYKGNWIAFNRELGLIVYGPQLDDVMERAEAVTEDYTVWHVSKYFGQPRSVSGRKYKKPPTLGANTSHIDQN